MPTQKEMADSWLEKHGIDSSAPEKPKDDATPEDDWASDAQRWYEQRAQGIDVAQLLRYQQPARE